MNETLILLILILTGLCMGSFAGAMVWRLRARQLYVDKKLKEPYDKAEYAQLKPLMKQKAASDRSRCLHCGYTLRWYDLLPLVSWLSLGGKCRSCRKPIGWMEPLLEIGVALFFVLSWVLWPVPLDSAVAIGAFIAWLAAGVGLAILFAYDGKWFLLPDSVTFTVAGLALVGLGLSLFAAPMPLLVLANTGGAVAILAGLYFVLHMISGGRWVGFGDVKLGLALGLLLADWQLALLTLFLANFIGVLIVIPLLASKVISRKDPVPFGPMLIAAAVIAKLVGYQILDFFSLQII